MKARIIFLFSSLIYSLIFCFFYYKYVPLIKPFQIILITILLTVLSLTSVNVRLGILFFVFALPLINNLPYFFGIHGNIPHAPTALVLFLVFFLGWMINKSIAYSSLQFNHPIYKPLVLFALVVLLSGIITFFRYANFFPFFSDNIYELIVNFNDVRVGGALMSDVFNFMIYLTGFLFFFVLLSSMDSKEFIRKILIVLSISTSISLLFSLIQKYYSISLGNTPFWINLNQINSTFKDPNSFGTFLCAFIPVLMGMAFSFDLRIKLFSIFLIIFALFVFSSIGSRSAFLGLVISFFTFFLLFLLGSRENLKKRLVFFTAFFLILVFIFLSFYFFSKQSILYYKFDLSLNLLEKKESSNKSYYINKLFNWKLSFWKAAVKMIKTYPLTGIGLGAFIVELPNYLKSMGTGYRYTDSVENYFLQIGSEMGLMGVFLMLWLFFVIAKQMWKSLKEFPANHKDKFILIGAISGIISIFVNFFFHSFIGGFDVIYFFWILIALVFVYSKLNRKPESKIRINPKFKIVAFLLICVFGAVHLWNSTQSLSLKSRTEKLGLKQDFGLYQEEKTDDGREFRWTRGYGGQTIRIEKPMIEIPLLASHPDIRRNPVKVKILLIKDFFREKKLLDEIILTESIWKTYEYDVPEEVNQEIILLIKVNRTWNPQKVTGAPDPRNLGVAVGKIQFRENKISFKEKGNQKKVI